MIIPNNWNILNFEECVKSIRISNKFKVPEKEYNNFGPTPIIDQGKKYIAGYSNKDECYKDIPIIIFGDHTRCLKYVDFPFLVGADGTKILKPDRKLLNTKYLFYYLKYIPIEDHGYQRHYKYLKQNKVIFPSMDVQNNIVLKLDKIDELLQHRCYSIELLDKYIQNTFYKIFGDIYKNPMNWELKKLNDLGKIQTGNTPPRKDPENYGDYIEWIKSDNINTPYIYLTQSKESLSKKGYSVGRIAPKKSVLMTCIAGSISSIGNVAIADRDVAFNQQINSITPNECVNEIYLYHLIKYSNKYIQTFARKSLKYIINKTTFEQILIPCPPIEIQNNFAEFIKKIEEIRFYQLKSQKELEILFNTTLKKAFNGELTC